MPASRTLPLAGALLVLATSTSLAEPPSATPRAAPPPPPPTVETYGGQTLLCDGASVVMLLAAMSIQDHDRSQVLGYLGAATFTFGAPIVHLVHDGDGTSASLGLRLGVGGLSAIAISSLKPYGALLAVPLVIGGISLSIVDAAVFARKDAPAHPPATARRASGASWQPTIATSSEGFEVGIAGRF